MKIMVQYTKEFEQTLSKTLIYTPKENYFLLKEKSFIFKIFEIFYSWIKLDNIWEVTKSIYGNGAVGNELNKALIKICNDAKKIKIQGLDNI